MTLRQLVDRMVSPAFHNLGTCGEDRAVSLTLLIVLVLVLLAVVSAHGQQAEWALRDSAAEQLARHWHRAPGDSLACLYGHHDNTTVVIDSAPRLARRCLGFFGVAGFWAHQPEPGTEPMLLASLMQVLARVSEWQFIAAVVGTQPVRTPSGRIVEGPQMLYAYKRPISAPSFTPHWRNQ